MEITKVIISTLALGGFLLLPVSGLNAQTQGYQFSVFYQQVGSRALIDGDYETAEQQARKKLDSSRKSIRYDATNTLCISLAARGKFDSADRYCQQALELAASRFGELGRSDRLRRWHSAMRSNPTGQRMAQALNNIGVFWALKGNVERAKGHFEESKATFPRLKQVKNNLARANEQVRVANR